MVRERERSPKDKQVVDDGDNACAPRVYEIEQRLGSITQGSVDVTSYYTELWPLKIKNNRNENIC